MTIRIIHGDARDLSAIPDRSVHCVATSPPYWGLRSYLAKDDPRKALEIGQELTLGEYVSALVQVFREVKRVLREDGTLWLNLGDCYSGMNGGAPGQSAQVGNTRRGAQRNSIGKKVEFPSKNLLLMPFRVAMALQEDGWVLRAACPWVKGNVMPESVTDRPTTAHETVFLFAKSNRYFADPDAVRSGYSPNTHKHRSDGTPSPSEIASQQGVGGTQTGLARAAQSHNPAGRNVRTSDFFDAGLDAYEQALSDQLAHVAHVRERGGLLLSDAGDPLAFLVNTRPYTGAHFAVWPAELVKPMVMFSTPEAGVCGACGAPKKRVAERGSPPPKVAASKLDRYRNGQHGVHRVTGQKYQEWLDAHPKVTKGWEPSCSCGAPAVPATVLDPFGGTGTTARVAEDLGRDSVVVELDAKSIKLAEERTAQAGLFARRGGS